MQEENRLRVKEDGVDVLVGAGRVLGGGRHLEGPQEAGDEDLELLDILLLGLHHAEHQAAAQTCKACLTMLYNAWRRRYWRCLEK